MIAKLLAPECFLPLDDNWETASSPLLDCRGVQSLCHATGLSPEWACLEIKQWEKHVRQQRWNWILICPLMDFSGFFKNNICRNFPKWYLLFQRRWTSWWVSPREFLTRPWMCFCFAWFFTDWDTMGFITMKFATMNGMIFLVHFSPTILKANLHEVTSSGGFCLSFFLLHKMGGNKAGPFLATLGISWYYCWWKKSCTSWYAVYPTIYKVLYIPGGAGFQPSTVGECVWTVMCSQDFRFLRISWKSLS